MGLWESPGFFLDSGLRLPEKQVQAGIPNSSNNYCDNLNTC